MAAASTATANGSSRPELPRPPRQRSARAARERRSEHRGRLGRRAARDDGSARPEGHARAALDREDLCSGRRADRRPGFPGRARHRRVARRRSRRYVLEQARQPAAAHARRHGRDRGTGSLDRRQSTPRLPADEHHVRLDVRDRHQPNHAERDRDQDALRLDGPRAHDPSRSARASGEHHAERRGSLDRSLGERRARRRYGRLRARNPLGRRPPTAQRRIARRRALRVRSREARAQARLRRRGSDVLHRAVQGLGHGVHLGFAVPRHHALQGDRGARGETAAARRLPVHGRAAKAEKSWWMFWKWWE